MLQDFLGHNPLMLGLISQLFGCVLQDDFERAITLLLRGAEAQRRICGAGPRQAPDDTWIRSRSRSDRGQGFGKKGRCFVGRNGFPEGVRMGAGPGEGQGG